MTLRALARLAWLVSILPLAASCAAGPGGRSPSAGSGDPPAGVSGGPSGGEPAAGPSGAAAGDGTTAGGGPGADGSTAPRPGAGDGLIASSRTDGPRPRADLSQVPPRHPANAGRPSLERLPEPAAKSAAEPRPPSASPAPRLEDLIRAEEARAARPGDDGESWRTRALLYAAAGRMEDVYRTLEGRDLGTDPLLRLVFAAASDRVNEHEAALKALDAVRADWRAIHPLRIAHAAFCSAARGVQDFTPYPHDEFQPGQVVGMYVELENFAVRKGRTGEFEVSIHADMDVITPAPNEQVIRLPEAERYTHDLERRTARPLDDLCLGLRVGLPRNLVPGWYRLRITVEDRVARKFAVKLLDFRVR